MKKNLFSSSLAAALAASAFILTLAPRASAITLVEVDFSGTGGTQVGSIASSNSQFTVKNSAVTFETPSTALVSVGGANSTANWVYDSTGAAATNTDLFTGSSFGSPTRFDLNLGLASSGNSYSVTSVQIDVRAAATSPTFEFWYRNSSTAANIMSGSTVIASQLSTAVITTYTINTAGISATDSTSTFDRSTGLRFAFYESTGTNNDNLQIDAIRVIGVPEPTTAVMLLGGAGLLTLLRRRRK